MRAVYFLLALVFASAFVFLLPFSFVFAIIHADAAFWVMKHVADAANFYLDKIER